MNSLPDELKLKICKAAAVTPLRRLVLASVENECYSTIDGSPIELWENLYGVRLDDGSFAVSIDIDSLPKTGVVDDELLDFDELDEEAVVAKRSTTDNQFCFDVHLKYLCMYKCDNHWAEPIGTLELKSHVMKSPLGAVSKQFRDMMPRVHTTCVVPRKQRIVLEDGDKRTDNCHEIVLAEAGGR